MGAEGSIGGGGGDCVNIHMLGGGGAVLQVRSARCGLRCRSASQTGEENIWGRVVEYILCYVNDCQYTKYSFHVSFICEIWF